MALKREMKITIGPDGNVNIEVMGVGGPECMDFSKFLEEELGDVIAQERTAEFYQESDVQGTTHLHVGGDDEET